MTMTTVRAGASTASLLSTILDEPDTDEVGVRILDAALAEYLEHGFRRTSVDDVARRAGLGRATIYRRFAARDEIVQAVLLRETRRFFADIAAATHELPDVADRMVEGFVVGLRNARTQPLLQQILASEPESSIPFLTTRGGPAMAVLREFLLRQYLDCAGETDQQERKPEEVAEILTRLFISLVLTPDSCLPLHTDEEARATARRYLAPLVAASV
ncbi:MAG TPA: helix-turn-helix domain-containing protein [Pseudonocardiaceae bacterium]|jgi:AcrR family transcriptional regulator|nr:helix-turn-helix domain-containing protein [Pseudonocardiaceae bacterium]